MKNEEYCCTRCEKPIRWYEFDSKFYEWTFVEGSHHVFGCNYAMRILGTLFLIPLRLIQIIIGIIILPFVIFKKAFSGEMCGGW